MALKTIVRITLIDVAMERHISNNKNIIEIYIVGWYEKCIMDANYSYY